MGGKVTSPDADLVTNKLYTLQDGEWTLSLPPMPTARHSPSAISVASSDDILVVAGGNDNSNYLVTVEVFVGNRWLKVQSLPRECTDEDREFALHNGKLHYICGHWQGYDVYVSSVQSLIDFHLSPDTDKPSLPWSLLATVPFVNSSVAVCGELLISMGQEADFGDVSHKIHAYSPSTKKWIYVGDMPAELCPATATTFVFPNREMIVVGNGGFSEADPEMIYRLSLRGIIHS